MKAYPWRVDCVIQSKNGSIACDQIRVVDKIRLSSKISGLSSNEVKQLKSVLQEMFVD
ncbi:type II toxin-antitoxin system PemK/MazF family toxin [Dyadobacter sp. CY343]|uniref:type II toxin-antitoxin system PemK/MazF family toxin n=1 Tax=Dyadobacter sp. CY343 TaxID=2907299 RepID=UPI001F3D666A|nr:type II toxin-antitoxin system PemK/MazF family toxin [Dyadobacter sp. CY343]MCE7062398.1 type II toxin-antitoxin system PemK/MazF family toxin [Dyadobacter sp. CY343]